MFCYLQIFLDCVIPRVQPHAQSLFHFQKFLVVLCACENLCIHLFRWEQRQENVFVFRLSLFTVDKYCFSTSFYWSLEQSSSLCHTSESQCFVFQVFPSLQALSHVSQIVQVSSRVPKKKKKRKRKRKKKGKKRSKKGLPSS